MATAHYILDPAGMAWVVVRASSGLGDTVTQLGPVHPNLVTDDLAETAAMRVQALVDHASNDVGKALAADPSLCSRCVRTLMRAAVGTFADAAKVLTPDNPRDPARYAAAWKALGPHVQRVQAAVETLRGEVAAGHVLDTIDTTLTVTGDSKWRDHYERAGAPLKAGQWTEYKLCACGDPTSDQSTPSMLVR